MVYISIMHRILVATFRNDKSIRHTAFTIELGSQVELPCLKRRLVTGSNDTLEFVLQRFVAELELVGSSIEGSLLHIRIAECCGHAPTAQNLHVCLHLPVVREVLRTLYVVHII